MTDDRDRDLEAQVRELRGELDDLRQELERRSEPPTGPLGLPRPPTPRELLEFTDEVAIPTVVAILEVNIKLLESLQRAIRLMDRERRTRERGREAGSRAADTAAEVGRATMTRVEEALTDLQTAIEGGAVPEDAAGADLLEDVRDLQAEIDEILGETDRLRRQRRTGDGSGGVADDEDGDRTQIDVDAELDTLRRRYGKDDPENGDDASGDPGNGDDGGGEKRG